MGRLLQWSRAYLASKGVDEPRLSAELLLAHAMGVEKIDLYTRFDAVPGAEPVDRYRALIRQAAALTPIAYLIGYKEFYSLRFDVGPGVLIPRPETEALVSRALEICRSFGERTIRVLDVGTGSGCIVVAICRYAANAISVASDISAAALAIAARNADRHGVADRVRFIEADGLDLPVDVVPPAGFDLLVSNPPYVPSSSPETLAENVRRHEPHEALFAGSEGLEFYRLFAGGARGLLAADGVLLLEIGACRQPDVRREFEAAGGWVHCGTHKDAADPHPRVVEFRRRSD